MTETDHCRMTQRDHYCDIQVDTHPHIWISETESCKLRRSGKVTEYTRAARPDRCTMAQVQ